MEISVKTKLFILFMAAVIPSFAMADQLTSALTMKKLVIEALKEGSSEGYVDDSIAKMFRAATQSDSPILVTMKRIKEYDNGCGRLHVEMTQSGIKDTEGHLTTQSPAFEFSICPNGQPPHEEKEKVEASRRTTMKTCTATIEKGGLENSSGSMRAVIVAHGCPSNGKSHWRYAGACKALEMSRNIDVTYPIDEKGHINIKLLVPPQCIAANNSWHAIIMDSAKSPLGDITAKW
jgi:hypothetical protein